MKVISIKLDVCILQDCINHEKSYFMLFIFNTQFVNFVIYFIISTTFIAVHSLYLLEKPISDGKYFGESFNDSKVFVIQRNKIFFGV